MLDETVVDQYQRDPDFLEIMSQDEFKNKLVQETEDQQVLINEENKKLQRMQMYRLHLIWEQMHEGFLGWLFGSYRFKSFLRKDENSDVEFQKVLNRKKFYDRFGEIRGPFYRHNEKRKVEVVNCYFELAVIRKQLQKKCPNEFRDAWYSWFFGLGKNPLNMPITKNNFERISQRLKAIAEKHGDEEIKKVVASVIDKHGKATKSKNESREIVKACKSEEDSENLRNYLLLKKVCEVNDAGELVPVIPDGNLFVVIAAIYDYFFIRFPGSEDTVKYFYTNLINAFGFYQLQFNMYDLFCRNLISYSSVVHNGGDLKSLAEFIISNDFICVCRNNLFGEINGRNVKSLEDYIKQMKKSVYEYHHRQIFDKKFVIKANRLVQINPKYGDLVKRIEQKASEQDYVNEKMDYKTMIKSMGNMKFQIESVVHDYSKKSNSLNKQLNDLGNKIDGKQKEDESVKNKIIELKEQKAEFEQEISNLKTRGTESRDKFEELNQKKQKIDGDAQTVCEQITVEGCKIKELEGKKQFIEQEMINQQKSLKNITSEFEVKSAEIKAEMCKVQGELISVFNNIENENREIASFEEDIRRVKGQQKKWQADIAGSNAFKRYMLQWKIQNATEYIGTIEIEIGKSTKELQEILIRQEKAKEHLGKLQEEKRKLTNNKAEDEKRIQEKLVELEATFQNVSDELSARQVGLENLKNVLSECEKERNQIVSQQKELENKVASLNNDIATNEDNILSSEEALKDLKQQQAQTQQELISLSSKKVQVKSKLNEMKVIVGYLNFEKGVDLGTVRNKRKAIDDRLFATIKSEAKRKSKETDDIPKPKPKEISYEI